jgi:hypothetical protein
LGELIPNLPEKRLHQGLPPIFRPEEEFYHFTYSPLTPRSASHIVGNSTNLWDGIGNCHSQSCTPQEAKV